MTNRTRFPGIGRLATFAILGVTASAWAAPTPEQAELADRLLQIGRQFASAQNGAPVAGALADAADRLFANDTRLLREAIDLRLSLGQRDPAIKLLGDYRRLDPLDQVAQIQSIDLITDGMQTADQRADYLTKVSGSAAVSSQVRSHAALLLSGIQSQRGLDDESNKALDDALNLNPLNARALQLKLNSVSRTGAAPERTKALVNLLMAEPMQYGAYAQLAESLARAGALSQASDLYGQLFGVLETTTFLPTPDDSFNFAAVLLAQNKPKDAQNVILAALKNDPRPARAHYLRILSVWQAKDQAGAQTAITEARQVLIKNLLVIQSGFDPSTPKVTDSTALTLPDVKSAATLIEAKKDPQLAESYLAALGDLAWLDAYFAGHAPDASVMNGIDSLAGPNSVLGNRITGFAAIAAGQNDEAKVKLSAVAGRDPLSQLGLLVLQLKTGGDKAAVAKDGAALLEKLPTDAWSAMVRWSLRDAGTITLHTADADAVIAEAAKLPREWVSFAKDGRSFYFVNVDVVKASVQIGEPMIVTVAVQNACDYPLAIGPGAAIDPHIPLDANVRGAIEQVLPAVAVANITGRVVLQPNESTRTTVRLDSAQLSGFSADNPHTGLSIFASAVSNPVVRGSAVAPGPGGYRAQARNVLDRPPFAYSQPDIRQQLTSQLRSNDPVERLHAVTTIGACAIWLSHGSPDDQRLAPEATALVQNAAQNDASATVRAVAWQQLASQQDDAGRLKIIQTMLASPDDESKLIGCILTINRSTAERKTLLTPLLSDSDEVIQRLSKAITNLPEPRPKTATTQQ